MASVIVFGPTGNIGSFAARTAAEHGVKVFLAMRDTAKAIPGLSSDQEKSGSFERVQADLTKADTVAEAVKASGAKRAFIYIVHGTPDHMKSTLEILKKSGIEFVVLLSSFTVETTGAKLREIPQSEIIPYMHAHVEANLEDVFGDGNFVAIRPGAFATNLLRYKQGISAGDVQIYGPNFVQDNITPGDMGRVSGTVLAKGPQTGERAIYLYGPEKKSMGDSFVEIGQVLGKDVKVKSLNEQEGLDGFIKAGLPRPFAEYMVRTLKSGRTANFVEYETGVKNVKLYTGKEAQSLHAWAEENRELLTSA